MGSNYWKSKGRLSVCPECGSDAIIRFEFNENWMKNPKFKCLKPVGGCGKIFKKPNSVFFLQSVWKAP